MATTVVATFVKQAGESGAVREFWIKMEGLVGLAAAGAGKVVNAIENPFQEDLAIIEAIVDVTTAANVAADINISPADDKDGTNIDATGTIADALVAAALGTTQKVAVLAPTALAGVVRPIWKAPNADHDAVDSWIATYQTGAVDASGLVYNLLVKVIPVVDLD